MLCMGCGGLASSSNVSLRQIGGARPGTSSRKFLYNPPRLAERRWGMPPFDHLATGFAQKRNTCSLACRRTTGRGEEAKRKVIDVHYGVSDLARILVKTATGYR